MQTEVLHKKLNGNVASLENIIHGEHYSGNEPVSCRELFGPDWLSRMTTVNPMTIFKHAERDGTIKPYDYKCTRWFMKNTSGFMRNDMVVIDEKAFPVLKKELNPDGIITAHPYQGPATGIAINISKAEKTANEIDGIKKKLYSKIESSFIKKENSVHINSSVYLSAGLIMILAGIGIIISTSVAKAA